MNTNAEADDKHLDQLALDALRVGEGTPASAEHAAGCRRCGAALADLKRLEARLREAQPPLPAVPPAVEVRVFRAYRESVRRRIPAPFPSLLRRWSVPAAGLAAAAALVLSLRLAPPVSDRVEPSREPARSGPAPTAPGSTAPAALEAPRAAAAVDIVDAFRLARALRDGRRVAAGWDADGNGAVDGADVEALARRAVAL
ncbi:MAG TPA: hypothetical protein VI078_05420 [bacterium]